MNPISKLHAFSFTAILLTALIFWNCNLNEAPSEVYLNLEVPDSITVVKGYDKITVNINDDSGKLVYPNLFNGPYHNTSAENEKLSKLYLPNPVPSKMKVLVDV